MQSTVAAEANGEFNPGSVLMKGFAAPGHCLRALINMRKSQDYRTAKV